MMNPAPTPVWSSPGTTTCSTRAAFATLERAQQRLLETVVFEGASCTELARAFGIAATEVRQQVGAAMLALYAQLAPADREQGGAVAAMLALRALDALDPDETALIDDVLLHRPALQRSYADYEDLVAELCLSAPPRTPSSRTLARLANSIDDDADAN